MQKILIVEDDKDIADLVALHLRDSNCEVTVENHGTKGHDEAMRHNYDLLVLDVMLPGMSGLDICKAVRKQRQYVPILMMTAKSEENDKVEGLELGADDYITKPFGVRELVARVNAILRRNQALNGDLQKKGRLLHYGELVIDADNRLVTLRNERVDLTSKEYDLLYYMAQKPGRSFSRQQLLDAVWGYHFDGLEHTVNSNINRLRSKIEVDVMKPQYVLTTWGVGYRFNDDL